MSWVSLWMELLKYKPFTECKAIIFLSSTITTRQEISLTGFQPKTISSIWKKLSRHLSRITCSPPKFCPMPLLTHSSQIPLRLILQSNYGQPLSLKKFYLSLRGWNHQNSPNLKSKYSRALFTTSKLSCTP